MSDEKIAEIRARHEEGMRAGADEDRAYLLAEVEKLTRERDEARAEVERSHKAHEAACRGGEWLLAEKVSLRARMCGEISDLRAENERLIRERDEALMRARAEVERLRAERDTLLLDARDFLRWFNRNYPVYIVRPSSHPDHPWCAINLRLNAYADTLSALDSGLGAEP